MYEMLRFHKVGMQECDVDFMKKLHMKRMHFSWTHKLVVQPRLNDLGE